MYHVIYGADSTDNGVCQNTCITFR